MSADTGRIEGLDLVRGLAVGAVMLRHAAPGVFPGAGVVGVVTFFVLSGYLISGLLLDEHHRRGRIDLPRFYRRRARRLLPPLLAVLVAYTIVTSLLDPLGDRTTLGRDLLVALTWTGNVPFLVPSGATFHLWTLATEEQFYLVWPALLLLFLRRGRPGRAVTVAAVGTVAALLLTALWSAPHPEVAYALPTSWAPAFVVGAAARLAAGRLRPPTWVVGASMVGWVVLTVLPLRGHVLTYLVAGPLIASLAAVVVVAAAGWEEVTVPPLRCLVALGTVSYAAYLWNYPLTLWCRPLPAGWLLAMVGTVIAAAVSWHAIERPLAQRRLRRPA